MRRAKKKAGGAPAYGVVWGSTQARLPITVAIPGGLGGKSPGTTHRTGQTTMLSIAPSGASEGRGLGGNWAFAAGLESLEPLLLAERAWRRRAGLAPAAWRGTCLAAESP